MDILSPPPRVFALTATLEKDLTDPSYGENKYVSYIGFEIFRTFVYIPKPEILIAMWVDKRKINPEKIVSYSVIEIPPMFMKNIVDEYKGWENQ